MKKAIFIIISAIFGIFELYGQNNSDTVANDTLKYHFVSFGFNFNLLFGNTTYLEISPEILFNSKKIWRPGLHFTGIYYKDNIRGFDYEGIGLVNELVFGKKFIIYGEYQKYFYRMKFPYGQNEYGTQIFAGGGIYFNIWQRINAKFLILYGFYPNPFLKGFWFRYYIFFR